MLRQHGSSDVPVNLLLNQRMPSHGSCSSNGQYYTSTLFVISLTIELGASILFTFFYFTIVTQFDCVFVYFFFRFASPSHHSSHLLLLASPGLINRTSSFRFPWADVDAHLIQLRVNSLHPSWTVRYLLRSSISFNILLHLASSFSRMEQLPHGSLPWTWTIVSCSWSRWVDLRLLAVLSLWSIWLIKLFVVHRRLHQSGHWIHLMVGCQRSSLWTTIQSVTSTSPRALVLWRRSNCCWRMHDSLPCNWSSSSCCTFHSHRLSAHSFTFYSIFTLL